MTTGRLDDAVLRRWIFGARDALARHRARIDALNVFPVPDGDTGTNLHLTLAAGVEGLVAGYVDHERGLPDGRMPLSGALEVFARATLLAARGNSGVILSRLVRGLADAIIADEDADRLGVDAHVLATALDAAERCARSAVAAPVEGTILTVARAAALGAASVVQEDPRGSPTDAAPQSGSERDSRLLVSAVAAACAAAHEALARTPEQLPALARAGVVDAGGAGLVVILDALAEQVGAPTLPPLPFRATPRGTGPAAPGVPVDDTADTVDDHGSGVEAPRPAYEVMYLLEEATTQGADRLRRDLLGVGDSVLVVGDADLYTVHVHTGDVGAAIEAGIAVGRPRGIRVDVLPSATPVDPCPPAFDRTRWGVVAGAQGPGMAALFEEGGAVVVAEGPGHRATPGHFLDAAVATRCSRVVVLPNDGDAILAAQAAAELAGERSVDLVVLPTRQMLAGLAALAVYDPASDDSPDRMAVAAADVRCGLVATASVAADTAAGPCRPGDVLGVVDETVVHVGPDPLTTAVEICRRLLGDADLVTLVEGETAPGLGHRVADALGGQLGEVDVQVLTGGQPVYDLLIGVE